MNVKVDLWSTSLSWLADLTSNEHSWWFSSTGSVDHISRSVNMSGKGIRVNLNFVLNRFDLC